MYAFLFSWVWMTDKNEKPTKKHRHKKRRLHRHTRNYLAENDCADSADGPDRRRVPLSRSQPHSKRCPKSQCHDAYDADDVRLRLAFVGLAFEQAAIRFFGFNREK